MRITTKVELKEMYSDPVTGFTGYCNAVSVFENGCVRVCLERADKDGKPEEAWFDEQRLTSASAATAGGPRDHAPRRSNAG